MVGSNGINAFDKAGLELTDGVYYGPARDLRGKRYEYAGLLSDNAAITPAGAILDPTKIVLATLNDDDTLTITSVSGEIRDIPPERFSDEMKLRLRNISRDINAVYRMPRSDSELNDLFPLLFPDYQRRMCYDVLRERERIDLSMLDPTTYEPGTYVDYSDQIEYIYYDALERRLRMIGCKGNFPPVEVRRRVLSAKFYETRVNPFQEWIENLVWDGEPRVDTWFQTIFNATAPPLEQYGLQSLYMAKVSRAWFCGAIARIYKPMVHEVVPVLIGGQGVGKTSGLRYTAGKDEWFIDTTVDVTTGAGVKDFLDTARGRVVIEMSEGTQIRTKDQDRLKAFISKSEDQYRKPYARRDESFPRHFILAASSNLDDVFTDLTGNRRYYPLYCHPTDFSERTDYDREQVWAEAKVMYDKGEKTYIPSYWFPAQVMQEYATVDNANVSMIEAYLDNPNNDNGIYTKIGTVITKEEVMFKVFGRTHVLANSPEDHAWKSWIKGTKCWVRSDKPVTVAYTGSPQRAYVRIRSPMQNPYMHGLMTKESNETLLSKCLDEAQFTLPMGAGDDTIAIERRFRGKMPAEIYREICEEQNITTPYGRMDISDLAPGTAKILIDECFIFYDKAKGEYRTIIPLDE